jgi:hypothetical protein
VGESKGNPVGPLTGWLGIGHSLDGEGFERKLLYQKTLERNNSVFGMPGQAFLASSGRDLQETNPPHIAISSRAGTFIS